MLYIKLYNIFATNKEVVCLYKKKAKNEYWPLRHTATDYFEVWKIFYDEHSLSPVQDTTAYPTQSDSSHAIIFQVFNLEIMISSIEWF